MRFWVGFEHSMNGKVQTHPIPSFRQPAYIPKAAPKVWGALRNSDGGFGGESCRTAEEPAASINAKKLGLPQISNCFPCLQHPLLPRIPSGLAFWTQSWLWGLVRGGGEPLSDIPSAYPRSRYRPIYLSYIL